MTDPRHDQEMAELAALYALEALGDDEQRQFERSLDTASTAVRQGVTAFQEVAQELAFSGPIVVPPASLKERLMARIAQEHEGGKGFTFVRSKSLSWQDLGPGLSMKVLFNDPARARTTMLLRLAPGGTLWHTVIRRSKSCMSWKGAVSAPVSSYRSGTTIVPKPAQSVSPGRASRAAWPW